MTDDPFSALAELHADSSGSGPPQAQRLIDIAKEAADLFRTTDGEPYASAVTRGRREAWKLGSSNFQTWLTGRFYTETGKAPQPAAVSAAIGCLKAHAIHEGETHQVHVRVGREDGVVYLDLADETGSVVRIENGAWSVTRNSAVRFLRPKGLQPLPTPTRGGSVDDIRKFVNVDDEDTLRLIVAWTIAALNASGPYPALCVQGVQGSAKSTLTKLLRSLVDPSSVPLRRLPHDVRDFMISASNSQVLAFDNLSGMQPWASDVMCCLTTGGGLTTRSLYSDTDETLFHACRPVILNGIDAGVTRGDLLDRSVMVNLPAIRDHQRRDERSYWQDWERVRSGVLGALLDALAAALARADSVVLPGLPRMADFARLIVAAEPQLGWSEGSFMAAYAGNRVDAIDTGLEADPLALAIRTLVEQLDSSDSSDSSARAWSGTATQLLSKLGGQFGDERKPKRWPTTPESLGKGLNRVIPGLAEAGWAVVERTGKRTITIARPPGAPVPTVQPVGSDAIGDAGLPELTPLQLTHEVIA
jgi:hypothetical protein